MVKVISIIDNTFVDTIYSNAIDYVAYAGEQRGLWESEEDVDVEALNYFVGLDDQGSIFLYVTMEKVNELGQELDDNKVMRYEPRGEEWEA